jgi:hypothetical protein
LLIHSEGQNYFGRSLLIESEIINNDRPTKRIWQDFLIFGVASNSYPEAGDELGWIFFPYAIDKIRAVTNSLENVFRQGVEEKLLYAGSILKIAAQNYNDVRTRVVMLTSIIELLLTHNPDYNRFNVEDSISKQFQLKASILVYLNDKSKNINVIKKRLKTIYTQRSNIAHGNFKKVEKYINNLSKKKGEEEYFEELVSDLYYYIRAILEEYLKDLPFIEFLKEA